MNEIKIKATVLKGSFYGYHGMPDSRFAGPDETETIVDVEQINFDNGELFSVMDYEGEIYNVHEGAVLKVMMWTGDMIHNTENYRTIWEK